MNLSIRKVGNASIICMYRNLIICLINMQGQKVRIRAIKWSFLRSRSWLTWSFLYKLTLFVWTVCVKSLDGTQPNSKHFMCRKLIRQMYAYNAVIYSLYSIQVQMIMSANSLTAKWPFYRPNSHFLTMHIYQVYDLVYVHRN